MDGTPEQNAQYDIIKVAITLHDNAIYHPLLNRWIITDSDHYALHDALIKFKQVLEQVNASKGKRHGKSD